MKILEGLYDEINEMYFDINFVIIDNLKATFENDYQTEKKRIQNQYEEIRKRVDLLEKLELEKLEESKVNFLESKFNKLFEESEIVGSYYKYFYEVKNQCKYIIFFNKFSLFLFFKILSLFKRTNN